MSRKRQREDKVALRSNDGEGKPMKGGNPNGR